MNDRYAIEARKLGVKVTKQAAHIDMLNGRIQELQKSIRKANELIEKYRSEKLKLEDFVKFANEYYPGCVEQYNALKKLEDTR